MSPQSQWSFLSPLASAILVICLVKSRGEQDSSNLPSFTSLSKNSAGPQAGQLCRHLELLGIALLWLIDPQWDYHARIHSWHVSANKQPLWSQNTTHCNTVSNDNSIKAIITPLITPLHIVFWLGSWPVVYDTITLCWPWLIHLIHLIQMPWKIAPLYFRFSYHFDGVFLLLPTPPVHPH